MAVNRILAGVFACSFAISCAMSSVSFAQREGGGGGRGGGGGGGQSGRSAQGGSGSSNRAAGSASRQSMGRSGASRSNASSTFRSSDGNRRSASQGTNTRTQRDTRDGARIQSNSSSNRGTISGPRLNSARSNRDSSTTSNADRRQQQSFFRGPTDRSNSADGDNNRDRNDENRQRFSDRESNDREDVASRDVGDRKLDGRIGDRRNRFDNDGRIGNRNNRFDNDNDWERFGRSVARNLAVRTGVLPFSYGWWDNYRGGRWPAYSPFLYSRWSNRPYYWWGWTPANRLLTNWFVFGWDRPRYWVYGNGGNIYCQDDYVYYDGRRYEPVDDYYQRMYDLAHSAPAIDESEAEDMDWAPLGVFAAALEDRDPSEDRTIQLAVNKDGVIAGTYYTPKSDKVLALTGMVDSHSQRAAWTFADDEHEDTIFETSVFNLTKPESTVMVLYGPKSEDTEVWHLVRLEQPETSNENANPQAASGRELP